MPDFITIHTAAGLAAMSQAASSGVPINLTHMAVGDGNGNPVTPSEGQSTLVRERFRAPINRVFQSPGNPNRFTAELIVPASTGGFVLREVGVFTAAGTLFAVGNLPDTYKPVASEGAFSDTVVRLEFMVTNSSVVTLMIDPNVAVATQSWVSNNVTAALIIPGGTTAQILRKRSNTDGDTEWADPTNVNVTVNSIEEAQTLAAGQTVVDWLTVNNTGLCVYIEGVRLRADQWVKHPTINTRITLGQTYPAGTRIVGAQNEPASTLPDPLVKGQNLADVPNKAAARLNLDVFSTFEAGQLAPAGLVAMFARPTAPIGWLKANGAAVSRSVYTQLFAAIGTTFGLGGGFSTFNLPDLRGEFLRCWDDGRGIDASRGMASFQDHQNASHFHTGGTAADGSHGHTASTGEVGNHTHGASAGAVGNHAHTGTTDAAGAHQHGNGIALTGFGQIEGFTGGAPNFDNYSLTNTAVAGEHGHNFTTDGAGAHSHDIAVQGAGAHNHPVTVNAVGNHTHAFITNPSGGTEARPRNIALLACIKI